MSSIDLFHRNRQMVESTLAILETLAVRLNTGEPLPNSILGNVVESLRQSEDAAYDASTGNPGLSECIAQHETARVLLCKMQGALESLERGEAGAVGAFVISARDYIRRYRDRPRVGDAYFPPSGVDVD
jgi:hypothetical protein